jgi:hypothetical protein
MATWQSAHKDLSGQLQASRDFTAKTVRHYEQECIQCGVDDNNNYLRAQLRRATKERDEERRLRLEAEDAFRKITEGDWDQEVETIYDEEE